MTEKCLYCGSYRTYIINNQDSRNRENLADDEDPDVISMGCDNCGHYEQIDREE